MGKKCYFCNKKFYEPLTKMGLQEFACDECLNEHTSRCNNCGELFPSTEIDFYDGFQLCKQCFCNDFIICDECYCIVREIHSYDNLCYECHYSHINNYSYKPKPIFYSGENNFSSRRCSMEKYIQRYRR